jgi:ChrB-like protein
VRAWRRLKSLGAVALKSGAYLLPFSADHYEQFQWLAQEVQKDRGEATLLTLERVENMKQPEIVRLFHDALYAYCKSGLPRGA